MPPEIASWPQVGDDSRDQPFQVLAAASRDFDDLFDLPGSSVSGMHKSVTIEKPSVRKPAWTATMASGTVDMLTMSAPSVRNMRYSARVSRFGPGTATSTPFRVGTPSSVAAWRATFDQFAVVGGDHVGKPRTQAVVVDAAQRIFGHQVDVVLDDHDVGQLVVGFIPPAALVTMRISAPRAFITRTGKVTCRME